MMIMTSSNKDIHTTKESFLVAAASYFGLPDDQVMQGSTVEAGADGTLDVVLRVSLTPDDLTGIAGRMKAMAEEQANQQVPAPASVYVPGWTREELREQYNALSKPERSQYGSFARYEAWRRGALYIEDLDPYAVIEKVELPAYAHPRTTTATVTEKVELPAHVYLSPAEATPQQKAMAIGQDEKGRYAIAVEDLTEEQSAAYGGPAGVADALRQSYVDRTMEAHARLNGTDGKPTSNADDFGGVPG